MKIEQVFDIICDLKTIANYAYDIHYNAKGKEFYSDHLFSERLGDLEHTDDAIDDIIETVYLGRGIDAPKSEDISRAVADGTPEVTDNTEVNFKSLRELIVKALLDIELLEDITKGEEDLFGSIAHVLQRHNGLLWRNLLYSELKNDNPNESEEYKHLMDV